MEESIEIIKSLLLPELENDKNFLQHSDNSFWEKFSVAFLEFEKEAKPVYELIYRLTLDDPEKILEKLPLLYSNFIAELAENHVLGLQDRAIDFLIQINNFNFQNEVIFLKSMQNAIKKAERKRIKADLPKSYNRLNFKLSEDTLAAVITKKTREDLKEKFKKWDEELEEVSKVSANGGKQTKVISLTWLKYAIAACFILGIGVWFFKFNSPEIVPNDNTIVNNDKDTIPKTTPKSIDKPVDVIAYETSKSEITIQYPSELGFSSTSKSNKITVYLKDGSKSLNKIEKDLKNELSNQPGYGPRSKVLLKQLEFLNYQKGKYEFDGKKVFIYTNDLKLKTSILSIDDKSYFIKMNSNYYYLYFTKLPLSFKEVKDLELVEQLEKINFENE